MRPSDALRRLSDECFSLVVIGLFAALGATFVLCLPSFEGPDESEHLRYVEACRLGRSVCPLPPQDPYRWGFEVYQPPLYYQLVGAWAAVTGSAFPTSLTVNPSQNPRYPFIRHDLPGHRYPWSAVHRSLRLLRVPSLVFGVACAVVLSIYFGMFLPAARVERALLLALAMLAPNTLHVFAIVANDGLALLFSVAAATSGIWAIRSRDGALPPFAVCGLLMGLGLLTKMTAAMTGLVIAIAWLWDLAANGRWRHYGAGGLAAAAVFALVVGPQAWQNLQSCGEPTRQSLGLVLFPASHWAGPPNVLRIVSAVIRQVPAGFAAELCWQSVRLGALGPWLFCAWLGAVAVGGVIGLLGARVRALPTAVYAVPLLAIAAALFGLVVHNRQWANIQVRHVWQAYPLALAALLPLAAGSPARRRMTLGVLAAAVVGVVCLDAWCLLQFRSFYRACPDPGVDRDYHTYLYAYHRNHRRGDGYLRFGSFAPFDAEQAFRRGEWHEVVRLVRQAKDDGIATNKLSLMRAHALRKTGQPEVALRVVEPLLQTDPRSHVLYARLLIDLGRAPEARRFARRVLTQHHGEAARQLQELISPEDTPSPEAMPE